MQQKINTMKLTSSQLRKIIREELKAVCADKLYIAEMFETSSDPRGAPYPGARDDDDSFEQEAEYAAEEAAEAAEEERYFKEKLPSMTIEDKWMHMNPYLVSLTPPGMRPSAFLEELFLGGKLGAEDAAKVNTLLNHYEITPEELPALIKHGGSLAFTPGAAARG